MLSADFSFEAIGTHWQIHTDRPVGAGVSAAIRQRIAEFDLNYSRFRPDSLVSRIARETGTFVLPSDAGPLMDVYRTLYLATGGAMTPLVGRSLEHLGYDSNYSLRPGDGFLAPPAWDDVMDWTGSTLVTRAPVLLDLGAAGKGHLVDIVSELLLDNGFDTFFVDGSGDLLNHSQERHRIALEHPLDPRQAIGVADLDQRALCASAVNRRSWANGLHHVVDGRSGRPTVDVLATWVVADSALVADALATALFFTTAEQLPEFDFSYVRMFTGGSADRSPEFQGELFT